MRSSVLRRGGTAAAVATLAFATTITGAGAADAGPHGQSPIEVTLNASGIHAPESHEGGLVTFRVKTNDAGGRQLQVLRPHRGVSIDQVLHDLKDAVNEQVPATTIAGIRAVTAETEALAGAFVTPKVHEEFTEEISAGTVYLLDFTAFLADPTKPVIKPLELCGSNGHKLAKAAKSAHGIVIEKETKAGPRFETKNVDSVRGAYLVHNRSKELHEMELQPVAPHTTDQQIQAFFDALAQGKQPPKSPFTGPPAGLGALSPGHSALLRAHGLRPGTYVLLCFIPDEDLGVPHAFIGMHKVVELH